MQVRTGKEIIAKETWTEKEKGVNPVEQLNLSIKKRRRDIVGYDNDSDSDSDIDITGDSNSSFSKEKKKREVDYQKKREYLQRQNTVVL